MSENPESRKLAAVMFADIEGYTSLFQRNEEEGLKQIDLHRQDLSALSDKYHGRIIKYYGDGSLTLFNSIIEAARCAMELQQVSRQHRIPLRIGIHMGEMIEKEQDVYGDAVNVTSRIQAIGLPGSILVSRIVADELKNHPDIQIKSFGRFALKNVKQPIEVYGLNAEVGGIVSHAIHTGLSRKRKIVYSGIGIILMVILAAALFKFIFPSKFTSLQEECIIIPPFFSHATNPELKYFGQHISSYLTKRMIEATDLHVIDEISASYYTNADMASILSNPTLARRMGAKYVVEGHYALEGDEEEILRVWMTIVDITSNKALSISIPDILCSSSNKNECIQNASNILAGYWKSRKDYLFQFTNDSAYTEFTFAQNKWGDASLKTEVKSHLLNAIQYDAQFIDAWFLLLDFFYNTNNQSSALDTIRTIKKQFPDLDKRQQDYLNFYEADIKGKNVQAFQSFRKEYAQNPHDLFINTTGIVMAMEYLNDPLTTLQMFSQIDSDNTDLQTCVYCRTRFNKALQAYTDLRNYTRASQVAERMKPHITKDQQFVGLIKYYVHLNDSASVTEIIRQGVKIGGRDDDFSYYNLSAAQSAAVIGNIPLRDQFARNVIRQNPPVNLLDLSRAYLLLELYYEAEKVLLEAIKSNPEGVRYYGYLGVAYAGQGKKVLADQVIQKLNSFTGKRKAGEIPYMQGRIKANLGEQKEALRYLKMALEDGFKFVINVSFLEDPNMQPMNSNPEYLALIASRRQYKFE